MKKTVEYIFLLVLVWQLCSGCTSVKKPVSTPNSTQNQTKSPERKEATRPQPSTARPKQEEGKVVRRQNDSLDKVYPLIQKDRYNVALLLPFFLYKAEPTRNERSVANISLDFYKGFLMAADTLKRCGGNFNIYLLENDRTAAGRERLKDTLKKLDIDLVIGPVVENEVKKIAPFCSENKINLVAPVASLDTCFDKTYYIESNPGAYSYAKTAADLVKKDFSDSRIFLVNEKNTSENPVAREFVNQKIGDSLRIYDYKGKGALTQNLVKDFKEKNVVFIPSRNEVFVTAVLSQLQLDTMNFQTTVIGLYPWLYFKSQEGDAWNRFHLHLICPYYIDYTNNEVKSFVQNFRSRYDEEPNEWSFRGFDEMLYYGRMLVKYGRYFQRGFAEENPQLLHSYYRFEKQGNCSGYRNNSVHILRFEDYELKKLSQ